MDNLDPKLPSMRSFKEMKSKVNDFLKIDVLPANRDYRPRFSFEEAARREIQVIPLDFTTGTPQASSGFGGAFIRPLPSEAVDDLLDQTKPWLSNPRFNDFINTSTDWPRTRREEALSLGLLIDYYLTECQDPKGGPSIIPDFSKWRNFGHDIIHLSRDRRDDIGCDWHLLNVWRYCTEPLSPLTYDGYMDPSKPHTVSFLVDHQELKDNSISTSELTSIYWLACQSASLHVYAEHTLFPVTVLSASYRTVRIVQGVVNMRTRAVELRVSRLVSFENGIRADATSWRMFTTLLGWILGEPIGETKLE